MFKRLFNNCGLKVLAVLCAAALSSYVYLYVNPPVNQTMFMAVSVRGLDSKLAIASATPELDRVRVRARGPLRSMRLLGQRHMTATLDCSEITEPGASAVRVILPELGDAVVADIQPALYTLQIETRLDLPLPVAIDRRGQVANGFVLTGESVTPSHVTLSGPSSAVLPVHTAQIEPDVSNLNADLVRELPIRFYGSEGTALDLPPEVSVIRRAKYTARIAPKSSIRIVNLIPDFVGSLPADVLLVSTTPRPQVVPVDASLAGQDNLFARTEPIDLSKVRQNSTLTVKVLYPFRVPAHSTLPETCDVDVVVEPFDQLGAQRVKVELRGADPKQQIVVSPPELVLRSEEVAELNDAQRASIHAVVDISGLKPGEYRLVPQLTLPPELDRVRLDPSTVLVTIIPQGG